jgi:hypothetical protein
MTDRDLLKAAAKAAGLSHLLNAGIHGDEYANQWNPLTDDGDALRLAVKLGISFRDDYTYPDGERIVQVSCVFGDTLYGDQEPYGDDPYAATRRAIVRAAAAAGSMTDYHQLPNGVLK